MQDLAERLAIRISAVTHALRPLVGDGLVEVRQSKAIGDRMRLLVISDVHLEFGPFAFPNPMPKFDIAVFAGDMHRPIVAALKWMVDQREAGPLRGREIVYVAGNHEFYNSEMKSNLAAAAKQADVSARVGLA